MLNREETRPIVGVDQEANDLRFDAEFLEEEEDYPKKPQKTVISGSLSHSAVKDIVDKYANHVLYNTKPGDVLYKMYTSNKKDLVVGSEVTKAAEAHRRLCIQLKIPSPDYKELERMYPKGCKHWPPGFEFWKNKGFNLEPLPASGYPKLVKMLKCTQTIKVPSREELEMMELTEVQYIAKVKADLEAETGLITNEPEKSKQTAPQILRLIYLDVNEPVEVSYDAAWLRDDKFNILLDAGVHIQEHRSKKLIIEDDFSKVLSHPIVVAFKHKATSRNINITHVVFDFLQEDTDDLIEALKEESR